MKLKRFIAWSLMLVFLVQFGPNVKAVATSENVIIEDLEKNKLIDELFDQRMITKAIVKELVKLIAN